ncbi:TPA: hypothetical protein ACROE7_002836, partial [Staphylococcus aureus]
SLNYIPTTFGGEPILKRSPLNKLKN